MHPYRLICVVHSVKSVLYLHVYDAVALKLIIEKLFAAKTKSLL